MSKGIYDVDCVTWSPQGKLFQVEYAEEAVKNGSLCLALRSKTHAVMIPFFNSPKGPCQYQKKSYSTRHLSRQSL